MLTKRIYSEETKLNYLREFYQSGLTPYQFTKTCKFTHSTLIRWIEEYSTHPNILTLQNDQKEEEMSAKHVPLSDKEKAMELKIKDLEKALEYEKMRSRGFEIMIDIAEKELNIPVRKKSGTKQ